MTTPYVPPELKQLMKRTTKCVDLICDKIRIMHKAILCQEDVLKDIIVKQSQLESEARDNLSGIVAAIDEIREKLKINKKFKKCDGNYKACFGDKTYETKCEMWHDEKIENKKPRKTKGKK